MVWENSLTNGIGYPDIVTNGKSILDLSEVESKLNLSITRKNTFSQFVEILVLISTFYWGRDRRWHRGAL